MENKVWENTSLHAVSSRICAVQYFGDGTMALNNYIIIFAFSRGYYFGIKWLGAEYW